MLFCTQSIRALQTEEPIVYTVVKDSTATLYYDREIYNRVGDIYSGFPENHSYTWLGCYIFKISGGWAEAKFTKFVIDPSFAKYTDLTNTSFWFAGDCHWEIKSFEGFEYINTSKVKEMRGMFYRCTSLTSLDLSNFNTSEVTDMSDMFEGCSSLKNLNLSNFNNSKVTNMSDMFSGCSSLTSLDLSNFNTSKVEYMGDMFYGCSSLTSLDLSNFNTSKVTNMSSMFEDCSSLKSLDLSNFNTSEVTDMCDMFEGCSSLTTLDVSNFNTSNVTNMWDMFSGCSSLKSLDLSNFNTSKVEYMDDMFYGCSSLTSLDLSNFNTSEVTDMYEMFSRCSSLTSLNLSNFDTSIVTKMGSMFSGCSSLTTLDVSNFNTSNVTSMSEMFYNCAALKTIYVDEVKWYICNEGSKMFYGCINLVGGNGTAYNSEHTDKEYAYIDAPEHPGYLTYKLGSVPDFYVTIISGRLNIYYDRKKKNRQGISINIRKWNNNNKITSCVIDPSVADYRPTNLARYFCDQYDLESIEGLEYLNTSNVTDMSEMFEGCSSLKNLNLSNFNTSKVTNMSYMFYGCKALTSLNLSNFNTSNVTDMSWMFRDCKALTSLDVSNFNTSKVTNMCGMFDYCSSLTSLNLGNFDTSIVTDMSCMFGGCSSLTSLDVSNFNTSNVTDMSWMFSSCSSLTRLDLSNFNTSKVTNMNYMFSKCYSLNTIYADDAKWRTYNVNDGKSVFVDCWRLIGGRGTTFYKDFTEVTYARVDKNGQPGYFMQKPNDDEEPGLYAILADGKLTIYYDSPIGSRVEWSESSAVTSCVIDPSVANYNPTDLTNFFNGLSRMESIEGLEYLNTSKVVYMRGMFQGCSSLTSLDLSNFKTSKVLDMSNMFNGCGQLTTIYADDANWNTVRVIWSDGMFDRCYCLMGENGTWYENEETAKKYARIDRPGEPGYLTYKPVNGIKLIKQHDLATHRYYTIDGKLQQGKPTKKGVYVTDGKKVVVK